jgi:hypothetical protein
MLNAVSMVRLLAVTVAAHVYRIDMVFIAQTAELVFELHSRLRPARDHR